ncbi:MAG: hypothetical protein JWL72_679 [Ilumatobacteraceae bacterium]|nr:hypothetical protein [Ilumatobacteraceae bacterium]
MTRRTTRIVIGGAVALLASCSSSSGDRALDLGATSLSSRTTAAVAPTAAPTTPPVTDPPTTVVPSTLPATDPPTTVAETTTTPPSKEDEVRAAYLAASSARSHCTYDPSTCDYAAISIPGSPMDTKTREVVAERTRLNLRGVEGKGSVTTQIEGVGFEGDVAFVNICVYDTAVLYDIVDPANPDDDIVYNDNVDSYRARWEMRYDGGRWLLFEGTSLERVIGENLCAA